ncbi:MAG: hypothetical protein LBJ09_02040 [Clostridiales bacterium]|jgi:hypothetical protein|nr:hypothetical protein [Clostridiales bacterium]
MSATKTSSEIFKLSEEFHVLKENRKERAGESFIVPEEIVDLNNQQLKEYWVDSENRIEFRERGLVHCEQRNN